MASTFMSQTTCYSSSYTASHCHQQQFKANYWKFVPAAVTNTWNDANALHSRLSIQLTLFTECLPFIILLEVHIQFSVSHFWDSRSENSGWWRDVIDYSSVLMTKDSCQKHWIFITVLNSFLQYNLKNCFDFKLTTGMVLSLPWNTVKEENG